MSGLGESLENKSSPETSWKSGLRRRQVCRWRSSVRRCRKKFIKENPNETTLQRKIRLKP